MSALSALKAAWSIGSSIPSLLSGGAGIWIRLGLVAAALTAAAGWGYVRGVDHGAERLATCAGDLARAQDGLAELKAAIFKQGSLIDGLKAAGAQKAQEAAQALKDKAAAQARARAAAARLRKLEGHGGQNSACPAGDALSRVREGLK